MEIHPSPTQFKSNPASEALLNCVRANQSSLGLDDAILYHTFPLYRDEEGGVVVADCILVSKPHGVITFALTESRALAEAELERCLSVTEHVPSYVQSRLVKNHRLRKGPIRLAFDIHSVIYAPFLSTIPTVGDEIHVLTSDDELCSFLREHADPMADEMFMELVATIEGAKGLIRPKKRELRDNRPSSKGKQAELIEAAITLFDQQQKHGMMGQINGPQRIRGLAGSGKTVVLAMKAAQMHLQHPDARIAFTFWTKSLYQHVKRLITRFYRQFDDRDPDWEHLHVLHGWGGSSTPGIYSVACQHLGVAPERFQLFNTTGPSFDDMCSSLLKTTTPRPLYDYVFVDEGQDFPLSFISLCHSLAVKGRFVLAYDDLQTIFQAHTPSAAEIFSNSAVTFEEDIVLHKCYRNPREVLVVAHALGFGIYGDKIVQMLESPDHWGDIGYTVKEGEFREGSRISIERPKENSLAIISDLSGLDEIVKAATFETQEEEIKNVTAQIKGDLAEGLLPEDILVACVDDHSARTYLSGIESALQKLGIGSNNLHADTFGIRDFSKKGRVTLSTVHKAKGNEAFMVYVIGVDAVMHRPDVRRRNMLFTAMTRAKGWVRVSGVGEDAKRCVKEVKAAKKHFPSLVFTFPDPEALKIMKRDLAEAADRKMKIKRVLEQLEDELSEEELDELLKETQRKQDSSRKRSHRKE